MNLNKLKKDIVAAQLTAYTLDELISLEDIFYNDSAANVQCQETGCSFLCSKGCASFGPSNCVNSCTRFLAF